MLKLPKVPRPGDWGKLYASPSTSATKDRKHKKRQRNNKRIGRKHNRK